MQTLLLAFLFALNAHGASLPTQPISGSVSVSNFPSSQAVTGTFWPTTQPVSGSLTCNAGTSLNTSALSTESTLSTLSGKIPTLTLSGDRLKVDVPAGSAGLTDTELRASAVPMSLATVPTHAVTQSGTWTVQPGNTANTTAWKVDGSAVVQPVSGTFWQVTQPVSGPLTDTQLRASAVPISLAAETTKVIGTVNIASAQSVTTNAGTNTSTANLDVALSTRLKPADTLTGVTTVTNLSQLGGAAISMNTGVRDAGTQRVTIATNDVVPASQSGTWNIGSITTLPALVAGTALIGKVGIDQTTPGTTNGVQVNAALPAGTNAIGKLAANTGVTIGAVEIAAAQTLATVTTVGSATLATTAGAGNPCQNPHATLVSTSAATSGTAAVQIVALSGSTKIHICALNVIGVSGTTPTFSLVYGTGSNCATGQATLVTSWATTAGQLYGFVGPVAVTPAGQAVCYLNTGTTPIQRYTMTYVQL